jgi:hypothetical protein
MVVKPNILEKDPPHRHSGVKDMKTKNFETTHRQKFLKAATLLSVILFVLSGCGLWQSAQPASTPDTAALVTAAAQTVMAEITRQAGVLDLSPTVTPSQEIAFSTSTPEQPVQPSETPLQPTPTSIPPTRSIPSLTPVPVVCNRAELIRDVTVEDNAPFAPGTNFVKTWRIKNVGSCTWTREYSLVHVSGNTMDSKKTVYLPGNVAPDQTVDLSLNFKAPDKKGAYRGDWMLSSPNGARFGVGPLGSTTLWAAIRVRSLDSPNLAYDFAAKICRAEWRSAAGKLPCPGTRSGTGGFVILLDNPTLENRQEDELTLWTHPNNATGGWISGTYPEFNIQPGHHFVSWIGCLDNSKGCNVNFRLDFKNMKTGAVKNLGSWHEVFDGKITKIDLDLSPHAGKQVRFILTVDVKGGDPARANAFWFVPGIAQRPVSTAVSTATATATGTATATATPTPTDTATPTATATETP